MKSDFKMFRRLVTIAQILLVLAIGGFLGCVFLIDSNIGPMIGLLPLIILGLAAAICEYAAYDNLICPYCGQRAVKSHREFPFDKANIARFKAISHHKPFECVYCHQIVETT